MALAKRVAAISNSGPKVVSAPVPSTDLNFTTNTLVGAGISVLADALSITRTTAANASNLLGTVSSFAINVARLTTKGLRVEGPSTNLWTFPEDISNGAWTKVVADDTFSAAATAPDGSTTYKKFIPSTTSGAHAMRRTTTGLDFTTRKYFTTSFFYEPSSAYDRVWVSLDPANASRRLILLLDPKTGSVLYTAKITSSGSVPNAKLVRSEKMSNGLYRISITMEGGSWTSASATIVPVPVGYVVNTTATPSYAGTGADGVGIWGWNLVQEEFVPEYESVTTLQGADLVTAASALLAILNQPIYSICIETSQLYSPNSGVQSPLLAINAGVNILSQNGSTITSTVGSSTIRAKVGSSSFYSQVKTVLRNSPKGRAICANGGAIAKSNVPVPTVTILALLQDIAATNFSHGWLTRIRIWNEELTDSQMLGASKGLTRQSVVPLPTARPVGLGFKPDYVTTRLRPETFAAGVSAGLIPANTIDFATGNAGGAFASLDAAITAALAGSKRLALPSGLYTSAVARNYAVSLYGYGASLPIVRPGGAATRGNNYYGRATPWTVSTAYALGELVSTFISSEYRVYEVRTAGTSAASGTGPSGTSSSGITDGTVSWGYVTGSDSQGEWMVFDDYDVECYDIQFERMPSIYAYNTIQLPLLVNNTTAPYTPTLSANPYNSNSTGNMGFRRTNAMPANYLGIGNSAGGAVSKPTRQVATIRVSGTGDLTALTQERQKALTTYVGFYNSADPMNNNAWRDDAQWAEALDAAAPVLISGTVTTATPSSIAAAINTGTGTHGFTATVDQYQADLIRLTMGSTERPLKLLPAVTGSLVLTCVTAFPNFKMQNCVLVGCDNGLIGCPDVTAIGEVDMHHNVLIGTWNLYDLPASRFTRLDTANNDVSGVSGLRIMRSNSASNGWGTIACSGMNVPIHMRYAAQYGNIIRFENNEIKGIYSENTSSDVNCPSAVDWRAAFARYDGAITVGYNIFEDITNTLGGNNGSSGADCNAIYWKTQGMLIKGNIFRRVGVEYKDSGHQGSETSAILGKAAGGVPTGFSKPKTVITYNKIYESPGGRHVIKVDSFAIFEFTFNYVEGWDEYVNGAPDADSFRGLIMVRGGGWDSIKIHSNMFVNIKNVTRLFNFHAFGETNGLPYDAGNFQVYSNTLWNDGVNAPELAAGNVAGWRIETTPTIANDGKTLQTTYAAYMNAIYTGFNQRKAANQNVSGSILIIDKNSSTAYQGTGTAVDVPYAEAA